MILGPIADKYGRRTPFLICNFNMIWIISAALFVTNINVFIGLCFLYGLNKAGTYSIGYVFYTEQVPKSHRIQFGLLVDLSEAAVIIYVVVYLQLISRNWVYLIWFSVALLAVNLLAVFLLVNESPRFLMAKNNKERAFEGFKRMARINGAS